MRWGQCVARVHIENIFCLLYWIFLDDEKKPQPFFYLFAHLNLIKYCTLGINLNKRQKFQDQNLKFKVWLNNINVEVFAYPSEISFKGAYFNQSLLRKFKANTSLIYKRPVVIKINFTVCNSKEIGCTLRNHTLTCIKPRVRYIHNLQKHLHQLCALHQSLCGRAPDRKIQLPALFTLMIGRHGRVISTHHKSKHQ